MALLATVAADVRAQQPAEPRRVYTAEQAERGRALFEELCVECHLSSLAGASEAPPLRGASFLDAWRAGAVADLADTIRVTMPPEDRNSLGPQQTYDLVAFVLRANGAVAGNEPLVADAPGLSAVLDSLGLDGEAASAPAADPAAVADRDRRITREAAEEEYVRPPGEREIEDFEPVTAEMLLDPDPGDWLMFRRTYDGQGHSPLDQVDANNVGELRLAWSWAMADGVNQPTPLVYRGVMYLANPRNIIQALEADTGTLIWEYRRSLTGDAARGFNQLRNLAIYGDKIFVATKDAAMLALDARSGRPRWETQIADPAKRYSNTSGPIVVDGLVINGINGCISLLRGELLHHRPRRGNRRGAMAHVHDRPARRAGRRHLGRSAAHAARRRRLVDSRQLRPGARAALLAGGAGQTLGAGEPRADHRPSGPLHELDPGAAAR